MVQVKIVQIIFNVIAIITSFIFLINEIITNGWLLATIIIFCVLNIVCISVGIDIDD